MHLVLSFHLFGSALNFQLSFLLDTKRKLAFTWEAGWACVLLKGENCWVGRGREGREGACWSRPGARPRALGEGTRCVRTETFLCRGSDHGMKMQCPRSLAIWRHPCAKREQICLNLNLRTAVGGKERKGRKNVGTGWGWPEIVRVRSLNSKYSGRCDFFPPPHWLRTGDLIEMGAKVQADWVHS